MLVNLLLVEGKLDEEILFPIFAGNPAIHAGICSKNALAPRVRTERQEKKPGTYYVRDRDFDYLPPGISIEPVVDRWEDESQQSILGWRWCRHSIECYMLEPSIISAALGIDQDEYINALIKAGKLIRYYQAARWTIGTARQVLPPNHKFQTFPQEAEYHEFFCPKELSESSSSTWVHSHAEKFFENVSNALNDANISQVFMKNVILFSDEFLNSVDHILHWFSGKDLMTILMDWLRGNSIKNPDNLRTIIRDWMISNPDKTLEMLPEWQRFTEIVRTHP